MFEELSGKFVIIVFMNGSQEQRTIAYVVSVEGDFITLEAPARRSRYMVNLKNIISISELPESQVKPEYRR